MGEIILGPSLGFSREMPPLTKINGKEEGKEENGNKEKKSSKKTYLSAGLSPYIFVNNPFSGLSSKERYVPPHPDDIAQKKSSTKPIEITKDYSIARLPLGFYVSAGIFFTRLLGIKNTLSFFPRVENGIGDYNGGNPLKEGEYHFPPINRQKYSSGEDAFTFISVRNVLVNDLSLVFSPQIGDVWINLEIGYNLTGIEYQYGWDRYAKIEFGSSEYHAHHGLHLGIHLISNFEDREETKGDKRFGIPVGGLSYSISPDSVQTFMVDIFGFEAVF